MNEKMSPDSARCIIVNVLFVIVVSLKILIRERIFIRDVLAAVLIKNGFDNFTHTEYGTIKTLKNMTTTYQQAIETTFSIANSSVLVVIFDFCDVIGPKGATILLHVPIVVDWQRCEIERFLLKFSIATYQK